MGRDAAQVGLRLEALRRDAAHVGVRLEMFGGRELLGDPVPFSEEGAAERPWARRPRSAEFGEIWSGKDEYDEP